MTTSSQLASYAAAFVRGSEAPTTVQVQKLLLSAQQRGWVEAAWKHLDLKKATDLCVDLVNIYSPSGFEREVNQFTVDYWKKLGIHAYYQELDAQHGNAVAKVAGDGSGATLLVACPSDSHWTGKPELDGLQWGEPMRRTNMRPAEVRGQTIIGLDAGNKRTAAAVMIAVEALHKVGVPLRGTLIASTLAVSEPHLTLDRELGRNVGVYSGAYHLLSQGHTPDFAVYHKPGHHVSWEVGGMCYFRVRVVGDPVYMATERVYRQDLPYRVMTDTARIVLALDAWSEEYRNTVGGGTYRPGMSIGSIHAGTPNKANWGPAISEIFLDILAAPWTSPSEINHLFHKVMTKIVKDNPGMQAEWEMIASVPGGRTDPNNWIIQSAIRAAQAVDGDTSDVYEGRGSVAEAASIFRTWGIPTAHTTGGAPNPELSPEERRLYFMSGTYAPTIVTQAQMLIYTIVDTLTRTREEVGLGY